MKLFILFASLALASASYAGRSSLLVREDGRTILIRSQDGRELAITQQPHGQIMEILVTGPDSMDRTIEIDENNQIRVSSGMRNYETIMREENLMGRDKRSHKSDDVVTEVMREYRNVIDRASYEKLMKKVQKAVEKGTLSGQMLDELQAMGELRGWTQRQQLGNQMMTRSDWMSTGTQRGQNWWPAMRNRETLPAWRSDDYMSNAQPRNMWWQQTPRSEIRDSDRITMMMRPSGEHMMQDYDMSLNQQVPWYQRRNMPLSWEN